ncbi:iron uptake transporter deferrochelatase/peroxidase subunit [Lysinibacter cavernae]|uniref:Deferrochelatase n=1 Tax=Lysinibacter cavernae TaxID=1640652 RepID=A0A7X5QYR4_9MICO|nr:iron uptake transporter deferrochelatase/peroxidase subunit [Lysinibacter cavernae]NIH52325.1 deferrochelatase/peroxidase EfeB [Lysinibacter cavernae]
MTPSDSNIPGVPSDKPPRDTPTDSGESSEAASTPAGLSRRGLLGLLGIGASAGFIGGAATVAAVARGEAVAPTNGDQFPFYGTTQAGVTTPAQDRLFFATFDVTASATRDDLIELLQDWSYAASRLTQGLDVSERGAVGGSPLLPPDDTGDALGLPASGLTITFGVGPSLFQDANGNDRFGIADRKPAALADLPAFAFDLLSPSMTGGDLCIQACADDPQVAVHAVRNLSRIAFGRAQIRWSQLGFGRTSSTSSAQQTPRNLFGFKDGTANVMSEEKDALAKHIYVDSTSDQGWMNGGTYLVARKILMTIESWDRARLEEQENIIGRDKGEGAPLSGGSEFTEPNFEAVHSAGGPAIPVDSHVRLAHPKLNDGIRLLRRGYNYVDGNNDLGQLNAGLFFISFQNDPEHFVRIQKNLKMDTLNEYIRHVGSAVFAIPPGTSPGGYVGEGLFA